MSLLCDRIDDVVARNAPMTVRQVFHQLVSLGVIAVLEAAEASEPELLGGLPAVLHRSA